MGRILSLSRYLMLLSVVACLAMALLFFVAVLVHAGMLIIEIVPERGDAKVMKTLVVGSSELVDLSLIGTAFYIVGIGLCELFIGQTHLPDWLIIHSLDDLKAKLIDVIVVVLAVAFLSQVVTWDGRTNLLFLGITIGIVILALTAFGAIRLEKKPYTPQERQEKIE